MLPLPHLGLVVSAAVAVSGCAPITRKVFPLGLGAGGCWAREMTTGNGAVWVSGFAVVDEDDALYWVTKIDARTGKSVGDIDAHDGVQRLVTEPGVLWAAIRGHVEKIDAETFVTLRRTRIGRKSIGGMAIGDGALWVTQSGDVVRLTRDSVAIVARIRVTGRPGQIASGGEAVWVATDKGVSRIDPGINTEVATITLPHSRERDIVFAASRVWVVNGGALTQIDPQTNGIVTGSTFDSVQQVIPATASSVWVLQRTKSASKYRLVEFDPLTNRIGREGPLHDWVLRKTAVATGATPLAVH